MASSPLISVVVPVDRVELYLDRCIRSIVEQTFTNLEIILVDDGSPDKCGLICDMLARKDSRIRVVHKPNGGLSSARNAGIKIAQGKYIGFVDSDDYISPVFYEKLIEPLIRYSNLAMVGCMVWQTIDEQMEPVKKEWHIDTPLLIQHDKFVHEMFQYGFAHYAWNKLYRTELVKQVPFVEGRNNEDTFFMYDFSKLMQKEQLDYYIIPDYLYYYTIRPDSICRDDSRLLVVDKILNYRDIAHDLAKTDAKEADNLKLFWQMNIINILNGCLYDKEWHSQYYHILRPILDSEVNMGFLLKRHVEPRLILRLLKLKYIPFLSEYIIKKHR